MTDQRIKEILDAIPVCEGGIFMPQDTHAALQQVRDEMVKEMAAMLGEAWEAGKMKTWGLSEEYSPDKQTSINNIIKKYSV